MAAEQLLLPDGAVTRADVGRLMREAEAVDNFLNQSATRQPGTSVELPKTSRLLDEMVATNKLNLLQPADRKRLGDFLKVVRTKAPVLHISFNSDPSPIFQQRLITWIRQQMHPYVLLQIGLHPSIGAGCIVRTTNKFFDFSLRQRFSEQRMLLISKLRGAEDPKVDAVQVEPTEPGTSNPAASAVAAKPGSPA